MSGKWLTVFIVASCVFLATTVLWLRSRDTVRVREFWSPQIASLIQHAPHVERMNASEWQDISNAPGLIHLRATLVEDRYYRWPWRLATEIELAASMYPVQLLRFSSNTAKVEVSIDFVKGTVLNVQAKRAAQLIPTSRDAIARYLMDFD